MPEGLTTQRTNQGPIVKILTFTDVFTDAVIILPIASKKYRRKSFTDADSKILHFCLQHSAAFKILPIGLQARG